jgi:hypothetical protein
MKDNRIIISGIISILSSSTLVVGIINYVSSEKAKVENENKEAVKNYIEFISGSFDKIDNYFISHPKELHELYYEFYGDNFFPKNKDNKQNIDYRESIENIDNKVNKDKDKDSNNISPLEYIIILKIIQNMENIYIVDENIYQDIYVLNRISSYTKSKKLIKVLSFNKNKYDSKFIKKLNDLDLIKYSELEVENVSIPKV